MLLPLRSTLSPLMTPAIVAAAGAATYLATVLADSPIGYWRLGEASGTSAADASGNGHTGTYTPNSGGSWTGGTLGTTGLITGDADTAATFNSSGYVATTGIDAALAGATHATLEAWISRSSTSNIITLGCSGSSTDAFQFVWFSDGNIYFQIENANTSFPFTALAGTGRHHIVMAYDGSQSGLARMTVYIDGSAIMLTVGGGGGDPPASISNSVGAFEIGRDFAQSRLSNGITDEVAVYSTTLSSARVLAHYNAGV